MNQQGKLKSSYRVEILDEETVLLLGENKNALLTGKWYVLVLRHLVNEGVTVDELLASLKGEVTPAEIIYTVNRLKSDGYIVETYSTVAPTSFAYWHRLGIDVDNLHEVLNTKPVTVENVGILNDVMEIFKKVLERNGIHTGPGGVLRVVVTDDYEREGLAGINRQALAAKQPWLLLKPSGINPWLGPLFIPGQTGCWQCLKQRLVLNRPAHTFYQARKSSQEVPIPPLAFSPLSMEVALNLSAMEIIQWLYWGKNEGLTGKIKTVDTGALGVKSHVLVKRENCPVCGEGGKKERLPVAVILKRKSSYCLSQQGGYREVPFEDTIATYEHHVSSITGIVQLLEPYFPMAGSPVYNFRSGHNVALKSKTRLWLNHHLRRENIGKGKSGSQAKAGALCEAIERYSCTFQGDEKLIKGSLESIGEKAIHPNVCMNYSEQQYQEREKNNRECGKLYMMVPVAFDREEELEWAALYSLRDNDFKYLPAAFCYTQYPAPDEGSLYCYPDTNGNAAGNTIEEAILQGFLELVERDSVALWWYNRLRKPGVDLESFHDPYFYRLLEYYASLGRSLYVMDITADLGIPAFVAVSHRLDRVLPGKGQEIIFAFGAHVEARIGIERALLEVNQLLPMVEGHEEGGLKRAYQVEDKAFQEWFETATMENQPYLVPRGNGERKKASDYLRLCNPTVYDSVKYCVETAAHHGLDTLVLDMTREDVGLNVVKVVVPGLRHFWKRLGPGRLYDVPIKMGWLDQRFKEEELNPIGVFI